MVMVKTITLSNSETNLAYGSIFGSYSLKDLN